jgi:hypothetical protein
MTQSSTDSSLVERLRGPHRRSECGNFVEVHPDFLNELDIALTAAGEALKELERRGLLYRVGEEIIDGGGRRFIYEPVR